MLQAGRKPAFRASAVVDNSDIEGVEYQRGTLAGYELGEYLLAKWNRTCAYCDAQSVPLEKEHIVARSKGGSDRVSNLTLACRPCNRRKDNLDVREFLAHDPARLRRILAQAKAPLKDAAAVNSTRWALFNALRGLGLPVETGSGARTKFNRTRLGVPKTHALDAALMTEMLAACYKRPQSGDVRCGNVSGSVQTMSGDVTCGAVAGRVSTMSGDIRHV